MRDDAILSGSPSYRAYLADLAARAKENPARPTQDPMKDWIPPYARNKPTVTEEPKVVSEVPDPEDERQ